ncbi:hypothetical protein BOTNAR_0269g00100 [Botryotinia narcissicola]|uniref:Uncharacterized protein n=2 Tax=Sclerotiniaceae TaxID=28983 RepID=A0A4Z1HYS8_9HELO|nr:hypothetical protein BOTNAR_0269g00100 [Botryotinia narcissicola]
MSSASRTRPNRRVNSLANSERMSISRNSSRSRPKAVGYTDAYTFALRVAYLHHLLQPRRKTKQYVPAERKII